MPSIAMSSMPESDLPTYSLSPTAQGSGYVAALPGSTSPVVITDARTGPAVTDTTAKASATILKTANRAMDPLRVDVARCIVALIFAEVANGGVGFQGAMSYTKDRP